MRVTEAYQLSDLVLRNLNQISSSSGLEYVYTTWFSTSGKRSGTSINIESGKACSRALSCFYVETEQSSTSDYAVDSFKSIEPAAIDIQFRLGSLYLPSQSSLRASSPLLLSPELFTQALLAFNKYTTGSSSAVTLDVFNQSASIFAASLERDTLGGAGVPISNSRILALDASFQTPPTGTTYFLSLYLKYVSLCRVYLSNLVVEN